MKLPRLTKSIVAGLTLAGAGTAQTRIDLRTQAKTVNFSQADSTRPSKTGTTLPAQCAEGETFLKLDAPAGRNWYVCVAGRWIAQGAEVPVAAAANRDLVLASNGSALVWKGLAGDISGAPEDVTVGKLLGRVLSPAVPATGQVLAWDGTSWAPRDIPAPPVNSVFGRTGAVTPQAGDYRFDQIGGTVSNSQLPAPGGDLSGAAGAATVSRIQNRPVSAAAPATGQMLAWSGAQWAPQTIEAGVTSAFGRSGAITAQTGDYRFDQIAGTVAEGQLPALGGDLTGAAGAATVSKIQNRPVSASAPVPGQMLAWSGAQWEPQTPAAGATGAVDATKPTNYSPGAKQTFRGDSASAGAQVAASPLPAAAETGDLVLDAGDSNLLKVYNGASWVSLSPIPANANYAMSFAGQTTVTMPGSAHQLGTANLIVACYDEGSPANMIEPSSISVNPATYDVSVRFPQAQSGRCVINGFNGGAGTGGGGGGGAVATVFGRTGDVAASFGDYVFAQISGAVTDSQIAAGLDAAKIGAGLVSNQHFGYLAGATGNLQAQLNAKAETTHTHAGGGDLSGAMEEAVVAGIRGRAVSNAAPLDGQVLAWNAGASEWRPATTAGGTGTAARSDFEAAKTGPATLTIGTRCSASNPCNVRFGSRVYSITSPAQATLRGGAGTAYIYIAADGAVSVGHAMDVACVSCNAVADIAGFPEDSIPLYSWSAAEGGWEESGVDWRGWLSRNTLLGGAGIVMVETGGQTTVGVDGTVVPSYLTSSVSLDFPAIAAGTCSGDFTLALPGAAPGDAVAAGWPAGLESGLMGSMRVIAAGQVGVRLCAMGREIDPASAVFRATIIRGL